MMMKKKAVFLRANLSVQIKIDKPIDKSLIYLLTFHNRTSFEYKYIKSKLIFFQRKTN